MSLPNGHAPLGPVSFRTASTGGSAPSNLIAAAGYVLTKPVYAYPKREDRKSGATKRQTDESLVAERSSPFEYDRISSCSQKLVGIQE